MCGPHFSGDYIRADYGVVPVTSNAYYDTVEVSITYCRVAGCQHKTQSQQYHHGEQVGMNLTYSRIAMSFGSKAS